MTDNLNLFTTFSNGPIAGAISSNADLYFTLFSTAAEKGLRISVTWMPSHLTPEEDRPDHVTALDLKGNEFADLHAGVIAKKVCLPLNVVAKVIYYYNLVKRIQKRLVTILTHLPNRVKHKVVPKPRHTRPSLETMIAQSNHVVHTLGSRVKCARCHCSYNMHDTTTV